MTMPGEAFPAWREARPSLADAVFCDGLLPWTAEFLPPGADLAEQLGRFHRNGCDHVSLTVAAGRDGAEPALARYGFLLRALGGMGSRVVIASDAAAIRLAKREGRLSVSFHFQTATPFTSDLDLVDSFRQLGITRSILAYNEANIFADGCHEPRNAGLSAAGRRLVDRMDEVGMIVDLSHCGERTSFDVLETPSAHPPIFSHSNARAIYDHERNLSDTQIRMVAQRGGYIGINGVGMFLGVSGPDIPAAMAQHAAHIAGIAGPERVGLGLDFMFLEGSDYDFFRREGVRWPQGYPAPPWDFLQPEQFGDLVTELENAEFTNTEIIGLLGENYLRLVV
jgi:membrane dipeptidase